MKRSLCWSHSRREFVEAQTTEPQGVLEALRRISTLYAIEDDIRRLGLTGEAKKLHRLTHSKPHVETFFAWVNRCLEEHGLRAALTDYVRRWSEHFGIPARLHTGPSTDDLSTSGLETTFYRLAQEALNNVAKHARADHVDVVLERGAGNVSLIIEDNGVGFEPSNVDANGGGVGLIGMRERAALIGGDLQIESARGRGTTIIVRAPARAHSTERV